jgi:hypothetical protein
LVPAPTSNRFREAILKKYGFYSHGLWSYETENAILYYMAAGLEFTKSGVGIMMSHTRMKNMSFTTTAAAKKERPNSSRA